MMDRHIDGQTERKIDRDWKGQSFRYFLAIWSEIYEINLNQELL